MKKMAKACAAIAACAGFVFSLAALSACGDDDDLITGDFSTAATAAQMSDVQTRLETADMFGDTAAQGWTRNIRLVDDTRITAELNYGEQSNVSYEYVKDIDHTFSFAGDGQQVGVRGSGSYRYKNEITDYDGYDEYVMRTEYDGESYSDEDYLYIDGFIDYTDDYLGTDYARSDKFRMPFNDCFDGIVYIDSFGDITEDFISLADVYGIFSAGGFDVYVDSSADADTLKVKISLDIDEWLDMFADTVSGVLGSLGDIYVDAWDIYDAVYSGYFEYYLEFDKTGDTLLGYGNKYYFNVDFDSVILGYDTSAGIVIDSEVWVVCTDSAAAQLPSDLNEYGLFI